MPSFNIVSDFELTGDQPQAVERINRHRLAGGLEGAKPL